MSVRGRLLVACVDGPLAGESFTVSRCPRVVRCVRAADGTADILNEPDDAPRLDESVHWYRWDGRSAGHVCGRGLGGCYAFVQLVHAPKLRQLRPVDPVNPSAVVARDAYRPSTASSAGRVSAESSPTIPAARDASASRVDAQRSRDAFPSPAAAPRDASRP